MAETKKQKYPQFTTPKLVFKYPKLTEPDYGTDEYPKPDGVYSVRGIAKASDPAIREFIKKLTALHEEAVAAAEEEFKALKVETRKKLGGVKVNDLYTVLYDQETEQETGEIEFRFSMKHRVEIKKGPNAGKILTKHPALFDARGKPIAVRDKRGKALPDALQIWGGTVGRISFEASPYFVPGTGAAGLKLGLIAAQIIDLVSAGERSASSYGFGEEDGYEAGESFGGSSEEAGAGDEEVSEETDF